jgi:hypothetical protein
MTKQERSAYWQSLLETQAESGLTGAAFCREHQINRSRFYYWRCRFKNNTSIEGIPGGFVELVPYPKKPSAGVHIHIGDGLHIEVERDFDPVTLRVAIQAVQG